MIGFQFEFKCTFEGGMCDEWKGPDANTGWVFEMIGERMDYEWEVVRGMSSAVFSDNLILRSHKIIVSKENNKSCYFKKGNQLRVELNGF